MKPLRAWQVPDGISFECRDRVYPLTFLAPRKMRWDGTALPIVLAVLMANPNAIVPKTILISRCSSVDPGAYGKIIDVYMSMLRRVLTQTIDKNIIIQSVWGLGYFMTQEHVDICEQYILTQTRHK